MFGKRQDAFCFWIAEPRACCLVFEYLAFITCWYLLEFPILGISVITRS